MNRRLDCYEVHTTPKLRFYDGTGKQFYVESHHALIAKTGKGEKRTITFRDFKNGIVWQAYRWQGRWAYGSSAWRLSVED